MTPAEKRAYYMAQVEMAKDRTPSTPAFVWVVPIMVLLALTTKAEAHKPQPETCLFGVCL